MLDADRAFIRESARIDTEEIRAAKLKEVDERQEYFALVKSQRLNTTTSLSNNLTRQTEASVLRLSF